MKKHAATKIQGQYIEKSIQHIFFKYYWRGYWKYLVVVDCRQFV